MLRTIVLIDDNDADLLYTRLILERAGVAARIVEFDRADVALDAIERHEIADLDLILLDINMPRVDGFAFLAAYESQPRAPAERPAPVVMLTSSNDPHDRERASSHACVCGYLMKPLGRDAARTVANLVASASRAT